MNDKAEVARLTTEITRLYQYLNAQIFFLFVRPRENLAKLRMVRDGIVDLCRRLDQLDEAG